jgi:ribosomal protein L21E
MKPPTWKQGESVQIERDDSTATYRYDYGNDIMAVLLDSDGKITAFNRLFYGKTWKVINFKKEAKS